MPKSPRRLLPAPSHPKQAGIDRQIQRAARETRGIPSQDSDQRLRAHHAECGSSAAEQKAFRQQHPAQRASACAERGAGREFTLAANRPRENQVGNVRASNDEDEARGSEKDEENSTRAGSNLIPEHPG